MENSVDAAIEKIKIKEQIIETKLKEKREYNVTVSTLNRSIRNTKMNSEKVKKEIMQMRTVTENIQYKIDTEKYEKDALSNQVDKLNSELKQLRTESEGKIALVWKFRANLSQAMKFLAESCDVRTLLIKSTDINLACTHNSGNQQHSEHFSLNRQKLENALKRREKAIKKQRNLLEKPEKDGEFIRIKEALSYSEHMVANLKDPDV